MRIDSLYLKDVGPFDEVTIDFPAGSRGDLADVYLLTGENGCGKSTVLYAIAAAIGGGAYGARLLGDRMRGPSSQIRMNAGANVRAFQRAALPPGEGTIFEPDATLGLIHSVGDLRLFGTPGALASYTQAVDTLGVTAQALPRFEWAAFAYSGTRDLRRFHVESPKEPTRGPFEAALSFDQTVDAQQLAQWFASQDFKRLKAKDAGLDDHATALVRGIREIEGALGDAIGQKVRLVSVVSDNDFRVAIGDASPLPVAALPDGLKSILAWVGDLFMRLDQVPWIGDLPFSKREFLLLLDEIDIHLHPAWQRRILPMVAKLFPKAQIVASTHSPFVVQSAEQDAHIIRFNVRDGRSTLDPTPRGAQVGTSVDVVLADVFGIESRFDIETESMLARFRELQRGLASGQIMDRTDYDTLAREIAARGEELSSIIGYEVRQLDRQLARAAAG